MGKDGPKGRDLEGVGLIISRHHDKLENSLQKYKEKRGKIKIKLI
jgi:hypothetical protein